MLKAEAVYRARTPFLTQSRLVTLCSATLFPAPQVMTLLTQLSYLLAEMALMVSFTPKLLHTLSSKSPEYKCHACINCRQLFRQEIPCPLAFALANAGKSMPARIAMMAITTSSYIKVKPEFVGDFFMAKKNGPHGPLKEF